MPTPSDLLTRIRSHPRFLDLLEMAEMDWRIQADFARDMEWSDGARTEYAQMSELLELVHELLSGEKRVVEADERHLRIVR